MDSPAAPPGPAHDGAAAPSEAEPTPSPAHDPASPPAESAAAAKKAVVEPSSSPEIRFGLADVATGSVLTTHEPAAEPDREAVVPEVPAARTEPAAPWSPSNWFLSLLSVLVAAADIASKEWAKHALAGPELRRTGKHIEVIPNHLDFIFAQNPGGAWSFLRGVPDGLRRPFFLFVSAAAIVFIVTVYQRIDRRQWAMRWGLPLALGGAWGNLADRVRYGWVVDFIDFYVTRNGNPWHWPTFNVADIAIVIGVGLMAIDLLMIRRLSDPAEDAKAPSSASETPSGAL